MPWDADCFLNRSFFVCEIQLSASLLSWRALSCSCTYASSVGKSTLLLVCVLIKIGKLAICAAFPHAAYDIERLQARDDGCTTEYFTITSMNTIQPNIIPTTVTQTARLTLLVHITPYYNGSTSTRFETVGRDTETTIEPPTTLWYTTIRPWSTTAEATEINTWATDVTTAVTDVDTIATDVTTGVTDTTTVAAEVTTAITAATTTALDMTTVAWNTPPVVWDPIVLAKEKREDISTAKE